MSEQKRRSPTDDQIVSQLRGYAEAAEREVPPTPASGGIRPWWRSPLAGLAAAAAVAVVVAGVALTVGDPGDDEVITPADSREPEVTSSESTGISLPVAGSSETCPGAPLAPRSSASAEPGFPVGGMEGANFLPYVLRIQGTDPDKWIKLAIGESRFGEHPGATIVRTVALEMCEPFSRATATVTTEAQVLDLELPTVRVYVMGIGKNSTQALIVAEGSASVTVDELVGAIATLRWEPEEPSDVPHVPAYRQGSPGAPPLQAARDDAYVIAFDSIGPYSDGQEVPMSDPGVSYDPSFRVGCGAWYPEGPPDQSETDWRGLVLGIGRSAESVPFTVSTLYVSDPAYRTASGVGVGTDLASLREVYGSDLVVDRMDGWEDPTDGLLASYRDVAAVRNGDRALTFTLTDDVVTEVKVSGADFWGDDEGCV